MDDNQRRNPARRLITAVVLVLSACASPTPLADLVPEGGTAAQRQVVLSELEAFDIWSGGGLELRKVVLEKPDNARGLYRTRTRSIFLSPGLSDEAMRFVLRHELCHAAWHQRELAQEAPRALLAEAGRIVDNLDHPFHSDLTDQRHIDEPEDELVAQVCGLGPLWMELGAEPCVGDHHLPQAVVDFSWDHVYLGMTGVAPEPIVALADPLTVATSLERPTRIVAQGEIDNTGVLVGLLDDDGDSWTGILDVMTGEPTSDLGPLQTSALQTALPSPLPYDFTPPQPFDPTSGQPAYSAVLGDEARIVVPGVRLFPSAPLHSRWLALEGGAWSAVEGGCSAGPATVVVADDQFHAVWSDGSSTLRMSPLE